MLLLVCWGETGASARLRVQSCGCSFLSLTRLKKSADVRVNNSINLCLFHPHLSPFSQLFFCHCLMAQKDDIQSLLQTSSGLFQPVDEQRPTGDISLLVRKVVWAQWSLSVDVSLQSWRAHVSFCPSWQTSPAFSSLKSHYPFIAAKWSKPQQQKPAMPQLCCISHHETQCILRWQFHIITKYSYHRK